LTESWWLSATSEHLLSLFVRLVKRCGLEDIAQLPAQFLIGHPPQKKI
jgi:hypothetical protein